MVKLCNGPCSSEKPLNHFHKGNGKHGVKSRCIECCKISYKKNSPEYKRNYYKNNRSKELESRQRYRLKNLEKCRQRGREYDKRNRARRAAREAFRRAQKLKATPNWLTDEHREQMLNKYKLRDRLISETGIMYHVDHVLPLISDYVCGLHVPWNLEVITETNNLSKSNKVG